MQRPVRLAAALLVSGIVNALRSSSRQGVSWVCVEERKVEGQDWDRRQV